ncbi:MAG TPA: DNA repair protein RecN [Woeseiaceae bacterium]|nr:DNA repair protein RecN [Woeseiaceae bacterium]
MLTSLEVRDYAIVDRISVEFDAGMTVLTGETGAGKSILVDSLGLVLGERGSAQAVRKGAKRAEFSAGFDVAHLPRVRNWLLEQSLDDDDACLLRRVINADGRSRAFINGNAVPVQQLKTLGEFLVDIHGQHFHQSLGKAAVQRDLLDHYGGLAELRDATGQSFAALQAITLQLQQIVEADADRESRLDLLAFQLRELKALDTTAGEFEALLAERQRLQNSGRLAEGIATAMECLSDGDTGNALQLIAESQRAVAALVAVDRDLAPALELLDSASIQINEVVDQLRRYSEEIDMDPARRDQVEERLDALQAVARKHRIEPNALPEIKSGIEDEYDRLQNAAVRGRELELKLQDAQAAYRKNAEALSHARQATAQDLASAVCDAMHGLGMPGGRFSIALNRRPDDAARAHGIDDIEFQIAANPGQDLMPLARVASGGELSRMSLAIQVIVSDGSSIPTMVFDEVDSGVGGSVAEMVGLRLAELGKTRQVLCVTHLAQVASLAASHFRIEKVTDGNTTRTSVRNLGNEERIEELARMIGGLKITAKTRDHAAEMLAGAPRKSA